MTKFTGISPYEQRYQVEGYYWGVKPNDLAMEVLKLAFPDRPMKLLDIGCGEGRDAVFFAKNGFENTSKKGSLRFKSPPTPLKRVLHPFSRIGF